MRDELGRFVKGFCASPKTQFKSGHTPWHKGKTHNDDRRIAQPWLGKKMSLELRKKIGFAHKGINTGEANWKWKGGITNKEKLERSTFRSGMQKWVFERDNYTCQFCGQRGGLLQVDHIQSWAEYVELRFSMDNCRTVCQKCHYKITFKREMPDDLQTWGHNFKYLRKVGY